MFWDKIAVVYDLFANFYNKRAHKKLCKKISSLIHSKDEVLECACGTGMLSICIALKCKTLVATDISLNMLKIAQDKCILCTNARFEKADILNLNYPDNSFDKVIAGNVIHLIDEPYRALQELDRVCKKGGKIIIPTYVNKTIKKTPTFFQKLIDKAGANIKQPFTYSTYKAFILRAGYKDVKFAFIDGRLPCAIAVITKP